MLFAADDGTLELRRAADGSTRLVGRFPYGSLAVLSDGGRTGRPKKEQFAAHAFAFSVADLKSDIHLLVGHEYGKPLASRGAGTLTLADTAEALTFEAVISEEMSAVSWVRDILAAIAAGLMIGLSPGFRIPPKRAVQLAEIIEDEGLDAANGEHNAIIRTILQAVLYELSIVTRPAYQNSTVEARNWAPELASYDTNPRLLARRRWRA